MSGKWKKRYFSPDSAAYYKQIDNRPFLQKLKSWLRL